ncbi:hypothetical protein QBC34DRAFT_440468 [Podospora aff. communis PSN243]|uniref:Uncharacterized protein n=1 Tax=Podospora aff. communis PSN243 TaxID=3040156 RepID=A0AAV9GES0_9PEZI|nr:hypothetical protein QBC34DRAFT_440468 [Podospora aff. communis PSN243]
MLRLFDVESRVVLRAVAARPSCSSFPRHSTPGPHTLSAPVTADARQATANQVASDPAANPELDPRGAVTAIPTKRARGNTTSELELLEGIFEKKMKVTPITKPETRSDQDGTPNESESGSAKRRRVGDSGNPISTLVEQTTPFEPLMDITKSASHPPVFSNGRKDCESPTTSVIAQKKQDASELDVVRLDSLDGRTSATTCAAPSMQTKSGRPAEIPNHVTSVTPIPRKASIKRKQVDYSGRYSILEPPAIKIAPPAKVQDLRQPEYKHVCLGPDGVIYLVKPDCIFEAQYYVRDGGLSLSLLPSQLLKHHKALTAIGSWNPATDDVSHIKPRVIAAPGKPKFVLDENRPPYVRPNVSQAASPSVKPSSQAISSVQTKPTERELREQGRDPSGVHSGVQQLVCQSHNRDSYSDINLACQILCWSCCGSPVGIGPGECTRK